MVSLVAAAAFFVGIHLFISGTSVRDRLVAGIGEQGFRGLFSLLSIAGIVWLVRAYSRAPYVELWGAVPLSGSLAPVLVLAAFLLVVVGVTTPSPTAVGGEGGLDRDEAATGILRVTRHPFLCGVALWAFAHLAASGDAASLVLFGSLLLLSVLGPSSIDRKRERRFGDSWRRFAARTSVIPFAAIWQGRNSFVPSEIGGWRTAAALVAFAVFLVLHRPLFGVSPLPM